MFKIWYGTLEKYFDITSIFNKQFIDYKMYIDIPISTNFNGLYGDPCPGIVKKVMIYLSDNNWEIGEYDVLDKPFKKDLSMYLNINSLNIYYGSNRRKIDITRKFRKYFMTNLVDIIIPKNTRFNNLFGDPHPYVIKTIYIEMGKIYITIRETEPREGDIKYKITNYQEGQLLKILETEIGFKNLYYPKSYLKLYEYLFWSERLEVKNILEISNYIDSSQLWLHYFPNSEIFTISNNKGVKGNKNNIVSYLVDITQPKFIAKTFLNNNILFDLIINKEALETPVNFIQKYEPLLSEKGKLIIENITSGYPLRNIIKNIPQYLEYSFETYDLRTKLEHYNGFIIMVKKEKTYISESA